MDNGKDQIVTKKIIVSGIVQGVGFRPLVYHIAKKHDIFGTVRNIGGLVEITVAQGDEKINGFMDELLNCDSGNQEITDIKVTELPSEEFHDFTIIGSENNEEISLIPPDLPVCSKCQKELFNEQNRQYKNPFISCMACGPRYTIIEELPYDRHNTTMQDFIMCPACKEEYSSPENRRFHAQTVSCNDCGPRLLFYDNKIFRKSDDECILKAVKILKSGGIIAIKGIGGYHLACSPFIEESVLNLRKLKGREEKPFAVMFDSMDTIKEYCLVSKEEEKLLLSKERPIVLLYRKDKEMADSTTKGSIYCGTFLPYTPLQILLLKECRALIMTSANISDRPIIKDDKEVMKLNSPYLDGILYNKRKIVRSVDDSVAKIIDGKVQLTRRSRGYVPYPVFLPGNNKRKIFAAGSDLKAAFCLYDKGKAVVSQHFGDLEERTVFDEYKKSYKDLTKLLKINPDLVLCDMHPNYFSLKFATSLDTEIIQVQHHHAHVASVIAENHLQGKVIGVAFDGTGYGTDGNVWGGEFLICEGAEFKRAAHLAYIPVLGGDSSMKDAARTAACFLLHTGLSDKITDERKDVIEAAIKNNINTILTSSMGRLFDAVSSILGICDRNSYEGECAIKLEKAAVIAKRNGNKPQKLSFDIIEKEDMITFDAGAILKSLIELKNDVDNSSLALGFHIAVADMIYHICEKIRESQNINTVALSGGVFQNTFLTEETLKLLRENKFDVYINQLVPANDGSISLGQTYIGLMRKVEV